MVGEIEQHEISQRNWSKSNQKLKKSILEILRTKRYESRTQIIHVKVYALNKYKMCNELPSQIVVVTERITIASMIAIAMSLALICQDGKLS